MKAEERHELKTNELAEWLANLPQWCRDNLKTIIYVAAAALIVAMSGLWYWYNKNIETARRHIELTEMVSKVAQVKPQIAQAASQGTDSSYVLIQVADNLQAIAEKTRDDQAAALALIKRGHALRSEVHNRLGAVDDSELEMQMETARQSYRQALQKAAGHPTLTSMAKLGLGLCTEELGDFETAARIYHQMLEDPAIEGTAATAQARYRLEIMDYYRQPVVFAEPEPEPAEPAVSEPAPADSAVSETASEPQQLQPPGAADANAAPAEPQDPNGEQPMQQ